jgi:hypothetical protein
VARLCPPNLPRPPPFRPIRHARFRPPLRRTPPCRRPNRSR